MKRLGLLLALFSAIAQAQFTTVSGTVTDPNGLPYAGGTITATLITSASPIFTATGLAYIPPSQPAGLDATGSFVVQLADNTQLSPGGTQWQFKVCSSGATVRPAIGTGPVCFTLPSPITISGSSQVITSNLGLVALPLINSVGLPAGSVLNAFPDTAHMLVQMEFLDGSGTSVSDSSGNGNNGTFCAAAPTWISAANGTGGLYFNGGSSQCVTLPAALNALRTTILVTSFAPGAQTFAQAPMIGNVGTACTGLQFFNPQSVAVQGPQGSIPGLYNLSVYKGAVGTVDSTVHSASGTQIITWQFGSAGDSTVDRIYTNSNIPPYPPMWVPLVGNGVWANSGLTGYQTAGAYQLGGDTTHCNTSFTEWYTGAIYYLVGWSSYLSQAQLQQAYQAIVQKMAQRNVPLTHGSAYNAAGLAINTPPNLRVNEFVAGPGDSITYGYGTSPLTNYAQYMTFYKGAGGVESWNWVEIGLSGSSPLQWATDSGLVAGVPYQPSGTPESWFNAGAGVNVAAYWLGTNGCSTGVQAHNDMVSGIRQFKSHWRPGATNYKLVVISMISRTAEDTCKDGLDALIAEHWREYADAYADVANDINLGADGANTNSLFQADHVHPTTQAQANNIAPIVQRAVNRLVGNRDWTSANTYTTAALTATATTGGSETGNTITLTFTATPANCLVGDQAFVTGVTPAGYNTPANTDGWQILTRSATQITYYTNTTGLGAITVQGTAICPQQQDQDVYTILAGSATSPSFLLEPCTGYTGQSIYLKNANTTSAWVLTPWNSSQTIDGAASLTMPTASSGNNPVVILQAQANAYASGGCTWSRLL